MKIKITSRAQRDFKKLPHHIKPRIKSSVDSLSENPYSPNCKKLTNQPGFRVRVGNYRILYIIRKNKKEVIITGIGHRKNIYR